MRLYEVKYQEDGPSFKAPGVSATEMKTCVLYYAAESMEAVWEATGHLRTDLEKDFLSVAEVLPLVTVLPAPARGLAEGS